MSLSQPDRDALACSLTMPPDVWIPVKVRKLIFRKKTSYFERKIFFHKICRKYAFIVESYDLLARNLPELMPEGMTETKHHDGNPVQN